MVKMAANGEKQQGHRPGIYKQKNKGHKHGKHRTKGEIERENKGKPRAIRRCVLSCLVLARGCSRGSEDTRVEFSSGFSGGISSVENAVLEN